MRSRAGSDSAACTAARRCKCDIRSASIVSILTESNASVKLCGVAAAGEQHRDRVRAGGADPHVRPVSGAHFNPVVSLADWFLGRPTRAGLSLSEVGTYTVAQCSGGIGGAVLANVMFDTGQHLSTKHRVTGGHLVGELVATAGLIALIFALARTRRGAHAAPAVGAYIGAAYRFTSSTSFANPAVTIGRMFTDTFAGIAPSSAPSFIGMQILGAAVGVAIVLALYPDAGQRADDIVIPHADAQRPTVKARL